MELAKQIEVFTTAIIILKKFFKSLTETQEIIFLEQFVLPLKRSHVFRVPHCQYQR